MPNRPSADPMGEALQDFYFKGIGEQVWVFSDITEPESIDPFYLLRDWEQMPQVEQSALKLAEGDVLDIGAGGGAHASWLADQGLAVTALEISPGAVSVLNENQAYQTVHANVFDYQPSGRFDTILLLMNGVGLAGNLEGFQQLLRLLKKWLKAYGQVLLDSTDLRPLMGADVVEARKESDERYYGIVQYQMAYGGILGTPFEWLFADWPTVKAYANEQGFEAQCHYYGTDHHWLGQFRLPSAKLNPSYPTDKA